MEPTVLSLLDRREEELAAHGPSYLRAFLESLVEAAAEAQGLVVGEAEPGRYLLVMPPLPERAIREQIDAGLDVVLARLAERWPEPHVTDLGLRELYARAREPWLAERGMEDLVRDGKIGVVTIFCHDWVYEVCAHVATEKGLDVRTSYEEYLRTGRLRVAGTNAFEVDVFANLRAMAADFDPIDRLVAKLYLLGDLGDDDTLASRLSKDG